MCDYNVCENCLIHEVVNEYVAGCESCVSGGESDYDCILDDCDCDVRKCVFEYGDVYDWYKTLTMAQKLERYNFNVIIDCGDKYVSLNPDGTIPK